MADASEEAQVLEDTPGILREDGGERIVWPKQSRHKKAKRMRPQDADEATLSTPRMPLLQL